MNLAKHLAAHQVVGTYRSVPASFKCSCGATVTGTRDQHLADTWDTELRRILTDVAAAFAEDTQR